MFLIFEDHFLLFKIPELFLQQKKGVLLTIANSILEKIKI